MRRLFTLGFLSFTLIARGQSYFVTQIPYNPMPFDSGISVVYPLDDTWSDAIPIGFDFYFFGHPYQELVLGTNCLVSFNLANALQYCPWPIDYAIPSEYDPLNSILFPWQDTNPAVPPFGTILHQVYGSPPNRKFVISFDSVPYYQCTDSTFTGQLILYETSGNIEMHLHHKTLCPTWNSSAGILGLQDSTGTEAYWASDYNYPIVWTAYDEAWRFSPDSNYASGLNRVSGRVFADLDHDCNFNNNDYALMNKPVIFTDGNGNYSYSFTDLEGYYSKSLMPGDYSFTTLNIANQYYSSNCPVGGSYSVSFAGYSDSSDNNFFADTILNSCSDLEVSMWVHGEPDSIGWFDPLGVCDTGYVELNYQNAGTIPDSGSIVLTLNDSVSILNSPIAYTSLGNNQYQFDLGLLPPGPTSSFSVMIQDGCDTIGTLYCFSAAISGTLYDCLNYNNSETICAQIGVPFDPNAMYVSSSISPAGFTDYLLTQPTDNPEYTITFQNTGTGVAHNVVVKTILDEHLNPMTVTPGISSDTYNWLILGDTLIFSFDGIELPSSDVDEEGSHGFVRFKVQQGGSSTAGTIIPESAAIYFDYLSSVNTNVAVIEIANPETVNSPGDNAITVYPNPVSDRLFISSSTNGNYLVNDLYGRILSMGEINHSLELKTDTWQSGIYFVSVRTPAGIKVVKITKQ